VTGPAAGPPLRGGGLDRAAHRRTDPQWLADAWLRARVLVVDDGRLLVHHEPARPVLLDAAQAPRGERYFVGVGADGTPYFAVAAEGTVGGAVAAEGAASADAGGVALVEGARLATLRDVGHLLGEAEAELFLTAVALVNWHVRHGYSPKTGRPTAVADGGWTRTADDGELIWPRTDPAVIVLVHDGVGGPAGRCLLGHNVAWAPDGVAGTKPGRGRRRYSCLAGFVEAGESAEAAVVREIAEEVGVSVTEIRYVASQAWPFPGSLMLGFQALADPREPVRVDAAEIADARWFGRPEVAAVLTGVHSDVALPPGASIANYLIRQWLADD